MARLKYVTPGRFWLGAILPMLFLTDLSYPYGLTVKRFVVVEPWTLTLRVCVFMMAGRPSSDSYFIAGLLRPRVLPMETSKISGTRTELSVADRDLSVAKRLDRIQLIARFPRATRYHSPPCTSKRQGSCGSHNTSVLRAGSNIGEHP